MLQKRQKAQGLSRSIKKGSGFVKGCRTEEFVVVGWVGRNFIDLNCVCIFKIGNMHRLKLTIDYALFLSRSVINQGFLTMVIIMVQCLYIYTAKSLLRPHCQSFQDQVYWSKVIINLNQEI